MSKKLNGIATLFFIVALSCTSIASARPPFHHGGPGRGPAPHGHHHDRVHNVIGGALVLGLGLGLASAISEASKPTVPTTPSYPVYIPPGYMTSTQSFGEVSASTTVPSVVVQTPVTSGSQTMYWCQASKNFYPYVTECSSGWELK